jgi:hypothetical protein
LARLLNVDVVLAATGDEIPPISVSPVTCVSTVQFAGFNDEDLSVLEVPCRHGVVRWSTRKMVFDGIFSRLFEIEAF